MPRTPVWLRRRFFSIFFILPLPLFGFVLQTDCDYRSCNAVVNTEVAVAVFFVLHVLLLFHALGTA